MRPPMPDGPQPPGTYGRFLGWSILGTLVPGTGLIAAGRRLWGGLVLLVFVTAAAGAVWYFVQAGQGGLVRLAADSERVTAVGLGLLTLAVIWLLVTIVSFHLLQPAGLSAARKLLATIIVIIVASAVLTPVAAGSYYAATQRKFIEDVFPDEREQYSLTIPEEASEEDPWAGKDRVNVLLLGSDADEGRLGVRTDTIMVASINTERGDTALFSVPRNLQHTPLPEGPLRDAYPHGFRGTPASEYWISSLYRNLPANVPEYFEGLDNPGAEAMKLAVGEALGLDIDYYIQINLDGFEAIVNALGGIEVDVPYRIPMGTKVTSAGTCTQARGWIEPGHQRLDGGEALWFARARCGPPPISDDYERMRRQRCLVGAVVGQVNPFNLVTRYLQLESATRQNIATDIGRQRLEDFAELGLRVQEAEIRSLTFTDEIVDYHSPDFDRMQRFVADSLAALESGSADGSEGTGEADDSDGPGDAGDVDASVEGSVEGSKEPGVGDGSGTDQPEGDDGSSGAAQKITEVC